MTLWAARTGVTLDPDVDAFLRAEDDELLPYDCAATATHARRLHAAGILTDGELAWVYGPRRHELATVRYDEDVRAGDVVLRDLIGASPSETVRVVKPDLDSRGRRPPNTALA